MKVVTIREIPDDVHQDLAELARHSRRSLQGQLLVILEAAAAKARADREARERLAPYTDDRGVFLEGDHFKRWTEETPEGLEFVAGVVRDVNSASSLVV